MSAVNSLQAARTGWPTSAIPRAKSAVGAAAPASRSRNNAGMSGIVNPLAEKAIATKTDISKGFLNKDASVFKSTCPEELSFASCVNKATRNTKTMLFTTSITAMGTAASSPNANKANGTPIYP